MVAIRETRQEFEDQDWVTVGAHTYGVPQVIGGGPHCRLSIGKYCSIGQAVQLLLMGDHRIDLLSGYPFDNIDGWDFPFQGRAYNRPNEITIGNDVWLGYGVRILHGVNIGDGAAVGAWAVVTKDVRPYAVVGGNPAREIKRRFDDRTVDWLLQVKWWDWPDEKVKARLHVLLAPPQPPREET